MPTAASTTRQNGILENTESAFAAAIKNDYAIECDLQITTEGDAVVFHDETLERVCDAQGMVRDFTVRQLKSFNYRIGKDRIQTLAELLEQVDGRVPLVIELKSHWDGDDALGRRALKVLESYTGPYAIMSFDPDLVAAVADYSPYTVRGITADRAVDSYYNVLSVERAWRCARSRIWREPGRTSSRSISVNCPMLPFSASAPPGTR